MENWNPISINIIAGVITAILIYLSVYFTNSLLIPWIRRVNFTGPDLSGKWAAYYPDEVGAKPVGEVIVKQYGYRLKGISKVWINREAGDSNRIFDFTGTYNSGQVIITYEDRELKGFVVGTIFLVLNTRNHEMRGKATYFEQRSNQVVSYNYVLKRS